MSSDRSIVIVGAGAAGTGTALALRRCGHRGPITLIGDEVEVPYDRPPLSKGVLLGVSDLADIGLTTENELRGQSIDLRRGVRALGLDASARLVHTTSGPINYDALVIATGAQSRMLEAASGLHNVHALRTVDDGRRLRSALRPGRRLGIIGGGLIGLEVAASARSLGVDVTVIEPTRLPLADRLSPTIAHWLVEQHTSHGVDLRLGATVESFRVDGDRIASLELADGGEVSVDEVLICIGAVPNTSWLGDESGVEIAHGVVCDEFQRAAENIYVVGDLACGYHPAIGRHLRMETRSNASEGAAHLARNLTSEPTPYMPVPFFWTDQYDFKIQAFGAFDRDDDAEFVHGSLDEERWILVSRREGRLQSVIARDTGKRLLQWRRQLQSEFGSANSRDIQAAG